MTAFTHLDSIGEDPDRAPTRVAYVSLETLHFGQASFTHVIEIVTGLRKLGFKVDIISTKGGGASAGSSLFSRLFEQLALQARLMRSIGEFDALYVRSHFMALPIALWARLRGIPVIHEINGKPEDVLITYGRLKLIKPLIMLFYWLQYRSASALIAVTDGLADWARRFSGTADVHLVSNGANTNLFSPGGAQNVFPGRYVIFVGGLVAWHGIGTMLKALRSADWPEDVLLVVVGDGLERAKLEAAAQEPRLVWLGRQPYEEVPLLLRGAIAALCVIENPDGRSSTGVAPLKLFEAMACGVPVIVSDLPFQADLVRQEQAGIVIESGSPDSLARAVTLLAAHPEEAQAMGQRGAAYVGEFASWENRAAETARVIRRSLRFKRRASGET